MHLIAWGPRQTRGKVEPSAGSHERVLTPRNARERCRNDDASHGSSRRTRQLYGDRDGRGAPALRQL